MKTPKPIHIFAAGKRPDSNGNVIEFTDAMLAATAAAYDPKLHEAPFVKGHPKTDDPAYGWASALVHKGAALLAVPRQVEPAFAEDVKAGRWKKRSASFYPPEHPSNPVPGVYYLKHIGFLGAVPPAVKGMPDLEFAEAEEGLLTFSEDIDAAEFAEWDDVTNASLWRRLRDWLIGEKGQEVADQVIPSWDVGELEKAAQKELDKSMQTESTAGAGVSAQFTEGATQVTPEEKAALEAENARLKQEVDAAKARDKAAAASARHADHLAFAEGLVKAGKLLPASKDVAVATMDFMAEQEQVVEFGEGDARKPLLEAYKASLQASPKLVEFGEVAAAGVDADGAVNFAAPSGYEVDADRLALHGKALAYQAANKTTYEAALVAVSA